MYTILAKPYEALDLYNAAVMEKHVHRLSCYVDQARPFVVNPRLSKPLQTLLVTFFNYEHTLEKAVKALQEAWLRQVHWGDKRTCNSAYGRAARCAEIAHAKVWQPIEVMRQEACNACPGRVLLPVQELLVLGIRVPAPLNQGEDHGKA